MNSEVEKRSISKGPAKLLYVAGAIAIVPLVVAGIRGAPIPEWVSHLCISVIVVAVVHLVDRYFYDSETRRGLAELRDRIVADVSSKTNSALGNLTEDLDRKSEKLLVGTSESLNAIVSKQAQSLTAMEAAGVKAVYASRAAAAKCIAEALTAPTAHDIRVLGISLNDFLRGDVGTALNPCWDRIQSWLTDADPRNRRDNLHVKILLIDPMCLGARLRSAAESRNTVMVGRLERDVIDAATALAEVKRLVKISNDRSRTALEANNDLSKDSKERDVSLEVKLYRVAPTMFLCHTDDAAFVQQYHFWTRRLSDTPVPVLEYRTGGPTAPGYPMHRELREHFEFIWQHASVTLDGYLSEQEVGPEAGCLRSGLVNAFTDRVEASKRIVHLLKTAGKEICIQGISLKSFFGAETSIGSAMFSVLATAQVPVKVLLLDPYSLQAEYRGYREYTLQPQNREVSFEDYRALEHKRSKLTTDTEATVANIIGWLPDLEKANPFWRRNFEVRTYDSAPACFMLLVDDTVLLEQYNFGKLGVQSFGIAAPVTLGTDMPLFEYRSGPHEMYTAPAEMVRSPYGLQHDHFEFAFRISKPLDLSQPIRTFSVAVGAIQS